MRARQRISEARVAQLQEQLGQRERAVIETLDNVRLATASQLERLHFTQGMPLANARQCRRTLKRLSELRVLARLDRRVGGVRSGSAGYIYALDVAGQRLASASGPAGGIRVRRPWTPGAPFVRHGLAVTELYCRLREAERAGKLDLLEFWAEPLCWRRFTGVGGGRVVLKPDAFVRLGLGEYEHASFIEVDRATQSGPTVANKLTVYRRYWQTGREQERFGVFPRVVILAPSEVRREALVEVCGKQPADAWALFRVAHYDAALDVLAGAGRES